MNDEPQHPGSKAAELPAADFRNGMVTPDGRHHAEVSVFEGLSRQSFLCCLEVFRHGLCLLHGHLSQLRMAERIILIAFYQALVADGKDILHTLHTAEPVGKNPARMADALHRQALNRIRTDAAHPDNRPGRNLQTGTRLQNPVPVLRRKLRLTNMYVQCLQIAFGTCRRDRIHSGKETLARIDEVDVHLRGIKVGIITCKDVLLHLRHSPRNFYPRRTASDDHDVHQRLSAHRVFLRLCLFKVTQDGVAQPHGLAHRLHRECGSLNLLVAEEVCPGTCRQNKVVVMDVAYGSRDLLPGCIHRLHLCHTEEEVFLSLEEPTEGERDAARFETGRGDLINQGRELVVIVLVDQDHLEVTADQLESQFQSPQSATYDDDPLLVCVFNVCFHYPCDVLYAVSIVCVLPEDTENIVPKTLPGTDVPDGSGPLFPGSGSAVPKAWEHCSQGQGTVCAVQRLTHRPASSAGPAGRVHVPRPALHLP